MLLIQIHYYPLENLKERIDKKTPKSSFEEALNQMNDFADQIIFKVHPYSLRAELDLIIQLKEESIFFQKKTRPLEFVLFNEETNSSAPKPKAYIDLGDLKYPHFIKKRSSYPSSTCTWQ